MAHNMHMLMHMFMHMCMHMHNNMCKVAGLGRGLDSHTSVIA